MNTIVVAAIALLVLVVLIIIFTGQGGKFTRGLKDCSNKGGTYNTCANDNGDCIDKGGIPSGECIFYDSEGDVKDVAPSKVCCVIK